MGCPSCQREKPEWAWTYHYAVNGYLAQARITDRIGANAYRIGLWVDYYKTETNSNNQIYGSSEYDDPAPRHNSGVCMSFLDGHVEWRRGYGVGDKDIAWAYYFTGASIGTPKHTGGYTATFTF